MMVVDLVVSHSRRYRFLEDREGSAEAAAFVGSVGLHELDAFDFRQQIHRFGECRLVNLGHLRFAEGSQSCTAVVEADLVPELGPRERLDIEHVVQELDELEGPLAHSGYLSGLLDGGQVLPHVMRTTPRWPDDVVETAEVLHE